MATIGQNNRHIPVDTDIHSLLQGRKERVITEQEFVYVDVDYLKELEETAKKADYYKGVIDGINLAIDRKAEPQSQTEISIDKEKTLWIKMDTLEGYDRVITERGELCRIFYEDCGECAHKTDRRIELPEYEPFSDALDAMDCQSR